MFFCHLKFFFSFYKKIWKNQKWYKHEIYAANMCDNVNMVNILCGHQIDCQRLYIMCIVLL